MEVPLLYKAPLLNLTLDNTKRGTFASCPRKFYWHHQRGLVPRNGSTAIRYGATFHGALEGYYKVIKEKGWDAKDEAVTQGAIRAKQVWDAQNKDQEFYTDYRTFEACMESFLQFLVFFQMDQSLLRIIDTEQVFELELIIDPDKDWWYSKYNYSFLPPIIFTGRIDKVVNLSGMNWAVEYKTTGQPMDTQVSRLNRLAQLKGYTWAANHMYPFEMAGALVTVHRLYAGKLKDGGYGKLSIDFRRVPQIFTPMDLVNWKHSFYYTAAEIYKAIEIDEWPQQDDQCYQYGLCTYARLCDQNKTDLTEVNTDGYIFKPWDVRTESAD